MAVLVIREPDEFSDRLSSAGLNVINCPLIRTEPLEDLADAERKLIRINDYDGIFVTSREAAQVLASLDKGRLAVFGGRLFVLGRRSFDILKGKAAKIEFDPSANTAAEMLDAIDPAILRGRRFLFIRGERSMRTIPDRLSEIAEIDETAVYRTVPIEVDARRKREIGLLLSTGRIEAVCFFSPSAVDEFIRQFGKDQLERVETAAIGLTTSSALESHGVRAAIVSPNANAAAFADAVTEQLRATEKI